MDYSDEFLDKLFDKTSGKCHICHKVLCFTNFGAIGLRGAWEIEHSVPKSCGGTDHFNNLLTRQECLKIRYAI